MTARLLSEREITHGYYKLTAAIAQEIKTVCRPKNQHTSATINESVDQIATKLARICSGNPHAREHWEDIIGYAELVLRELDDE